MQTGICFGSMFVGVCVLAELRGDGQAEACPTSGGLKSTSHLCRHALGSRSPSVKTLRGDAPQAVAMNNRLLGLHRHLFCEANPIPVKWAVEQLGLMKGGIRLPLTPLSAQCHELVREAMQQAGVAKVIGGKRHAVA